MKRLYYAILLVAAGAFTSCQREEIAAPAQGNITEVYATTEDMDATKTYMEGTQVLWSSGDRIVAFMGNTLPQRYNLMKSSVGSKDARFKLDETYNVTGSNKSIPANIAYYPFSEDATCEQDGSSYKLKFLELPSEQSYAPSSAGNGTYPMVAVTGGTEDVNFRFRNVCGAIMFQLQGYGFIKSISIQGNSDEVLCGDITVTAAYGKDPEIALAADGGKTVTLDCGEGVELNADTPTSFIISLPPVPFADGFTITVTDTWGGTAEYSTTKSNPILRSTIRRMPVKEYIGEQPVEITDPQDLSASGTANSYIVTKAGSYSFPAVKGNSDATVGAVNSVDVLWETFGTSETPEKGDLIPIVRYEDGNVLFATSREFREGNTVIAAKSSDGTILWSWHIWLTDQPQEQIYNNGAGTMMDRNLGAVSATPSESILTRGLMYQWGRKDPFLGSSDLTQKVQSASTIEWPAAVGSDANIGTIEYAVANPTTLIYHNINNGDWYYTGSSETDDTRWSAEKGLYDPCPAGWRVPDGGENGVWARANGGASSFVGEFDNTNKGIDFSGIFGSSSVIWYPAAGFRYNDLSLSNIGSFGSMWTVTCDGEMAYGSSFNSGGSVSAIGQSYRSYAYTVRCFKEGSSTPVQAGPKEGDYVDEYGVNHGQGVEIDGVVWAPVNCGYHATDFKYGKLYQWGRKYGQGYSGSLNNEGLIQTFSDATVPTIVSGPVNLATGQSKSNENNFYDSLSDWLSSQNDQLWNFGTKENPVKTEYDPCPSGWRVPTDAELSALYQNRSSWTSEDGQSGYWFSGANPYSEIVPQVFLPATGLRFYDGNTTNRGSSGYYWSSIPYDCSAYFHYFDMGHTEMSNDIRADGHSVRCVQDDAELIPVESIALDQTYMIIYADQAEAFSLNATISPANATHQSVYWHSDNTSVVLPADDKGTMIAVNSGSAVITAMAGMKTAVCYVTVLPKTEAQEVDYVDEYGVNHGQGIEIDGVVWAPVNCGYHKDDFKYGKLYQWGRKYGQGYSGSLNNENGNNIGTYSDATVPTIVSGPVNLTTGQSKDNENIYYKASSSPWDWLSPQNDELWNSGTEEKPVNTEYNPCPAGWRVPTYAELNELITNCSSWATDAAGQSGYWFSGSNSYTSEVPQIFLPVAGFLVYDSGGSGRGFQGVYWSSRPYIYNNFYGYGYCLGFTCSYIKMGSGDRDDGYSVRCVQVTD